MTGTITISQKSKVLKVQNVFDFWYFKILKSKILKTQNDLKLCLKYQISKILKHFNILNC